MNKNNKSNFKDIVYAIIAIVVSLAIYKTLGQLIRNALDNTYLAAFAAQLIFAIPVFISVILLRRTAIYRTDMKKLKRGWSTGLVFLIMSLLSSVGIFFGNAEVTAGPAEILLFILQMFLVGYCEETLYRGLLQNAFHGFFGENSTSAVRKAVFLTGIVFGMSHLLNALNPAIRFGTAAMQALGTAAMGCCMCAIYYRTGKSLWFLIALHALNDCVINIRQGVLNGVSEADAITASMTTGKVYIVGPILFYGLITLFLLRRKKLEQMN